MNLVTTAGAVQPLSLLRSDDDIHTRSRRAAAGSPRASASSVAADTVAACAPCVSMCIVMMMVRRGAGSFYQIITIHQWHSHSHMNLHHESSAEGERAIPTK